MSEVKNNIKSLDFPESIRVRSVMYMGDSNNANHSLTEVIDNASDHVFRDKSVTKIYIKTCKNDPKDYFVVANDGTPFPVHMDEDRGKTKADLACTHMHTGANFEGESTSIGQNGVGLKGTNALSEYFYVITKLLNDSFLDSCEEVKKKGKNNQFYFVRYERGIKTHESVGTLSSISKIDGIELPKGYITYVVSKPDKEIYTTDLSANVNSQRISDSILTFKNFYKRKIHYLLDGEEIKSEDVGYKYKVLNSYKLDPLKGSTVTTKSEMKFLIDFEFSNNLEESESSGNINTRKVGRGMHINSSVHLIGQALKEVFDIPHNYLTKGIKCNVLVLAPGSHLQLAGQTKDSLIRIKGFKSAFTDKSGKSISNDWGSLKTRLKRVLEDNREEVLPHVMRLNEYAISLDKLANKDFVKSMVNISKNSGPLLSKKVRDASSTNRNKCDLFIVEGKSAASSLLDARDPQYHGIFAMRGFSLNTVGKTLKRVFQNEEYKDLISAIGAGVDAYNDIDCCRYRKIIICADADLINSPIGFAA